MESPHAPSFTRCLRSRSIRWGTSSFSWHFWSQEKGIFFIIIIIFLSSHFLLITACLFAQRDSCIILLRHPYSKTPVQTKWRQHGFSSWPRSFKGLFHVLVVSPEPGNATQRPMIWIKCFPPRLWKLQRLHPFDWVMGVFLQACHDNLKSMLLLYPIRSLAIGNERFSKSYNALQKQRRTFSCSTARLGWLSIKKNNK